MRIHNVIAAVCVVALLAGAFMELPYKFIYNPTQSVPRGWYWQSPIHEVRLHDLVFVVLPRHIAESAVHREYLGPNVSLIKYVAGMRGDHVCLRGTAVLINNQWLAEAQTHDGAGRELAPWSGCRPLRDDEFFLLNPNSPTSFDSRYFGPVTADSIVGKATQLATEETNAWMDPAWLDREYKPTAR